MSSVIKFLNLSSNKMGNQLLSKMKVSNLPVLVEETQLCFLCKIIITLILIYFVVSRLGSIENAIVEAQFASIMAFKYVDKHVSIDELFEVLDNDHDGRIDGLELLHWEDWHYVARLRLKKNQNSFMYCLILI